MSHKLQSMVGKLFYSPSFLGRLNSPIYGFASFSLSRNLKNIAVFNNYTSWTGATCKKKVLEMWAMLNITLEEISLSHGRIFPDRVWYWHQDNTFQ